MRQSRDRFAQISQRVGVVIQQVRRFVESGSTQQLESFDAVTLDQSKGGNGTETAPFPQGNDAEVTLVMERFSAG